MRSLFRSGLQLVNAVLSREVARRPRPSFHSIADAYPALERVTAAYPEIRQEAQVLVEKSGTMPTYDQLDRNQSRIAGTTPERWSVFFLSVFGFKPKKNREQCPKTCAAIDGIPNLLQAFFSILDPGKSIPEHEGPYLGYLRYHLGLVVPADHPPTITVNGEPYTWKEGEAILFDDGYPHRVDNESTGARVVLIVDVRRPMSFLPDLVNRVVTDMIARWTYAYPIYRKIRDGHG